MDMYEWTADELLQNRIQISVLNMSENMKYVLYEFN